jgi:hypothetical protein
MGYSTRGMGNPTPPRDLELLVYAVANEKVEGFISYYQDTIKAYLLNEGVKDVVVYTIDHGSYVEFIFATSPGVPPWWGAEELKGLSDYVEREYGFTAVNRRELQIHAPEVPDYLHYER